MSLIVNLASYRLLTGQDSAAAAVQESNVPSLDIMAAIVDLSAAEVELTDIDRQFCLKRRDRKYQNFEFMIT